MADIRGTRLEAQEITRALPATEVLSLKGAYILKAVFGLVVLSSGMVAGSELDIVPWLRDCILWLAAIYITFVPMNTEALRWLLSEWQRGSWSIVHLQPGFFSQGISTSPKTMRRGDYVRSVDDNVGASRQAVTLSESQDSQSSPKISQQLNAQSVPDPPIYYRVIWKLVEPESGRIQIGLFGCEWHDSDPADSSKKYRRLEVPIPDDSTNPSAESAAIADTLGDLIDLLSKNDECMSEKIIGDKLINQFKHDPKFVRLALRIAESGCLVTRRTLRGHFVEQLKLFRRKATMSGHENCKIRLTDSGRMWELAGSDFQEKEFSELPGVTMHTGDHFHIERIEGIGHAIGGRENKNEVHMGNVDWKGGPAIDVKELAQWLAKLHTELKKHPTSAEQDLAIGDVASALIEAKKGNADEAMTKMAELDSRASHVRKWVVDTVTSIGIPLAVAAAKQSWLHTPPGGGHKHIIPNSSR